MAIAMVYPEVHAKALRKSSKLEGLPYSRLSEARTVLREAPELAVAIVYPEPYTGERKKKGNPTETLGFSLMRLSQARQVLREAPELAKQVMMRGHRSPLPAGAGLPAFRAG